MRCFNHHFLRFFVALLATMLIANTVYAGGMMVSAAHTQAQQNHSMQHEHGHEQTVSNAHALDHKPAAHGGCKHCNHCLACSSMMPNPAIILTEHANRPVLAVALSTLYLSPVSPQLQKPPIT